MPQHAPSSPAPIKLVTYRMYIILVTLIALVLAAVYYWAPIPEQVRQVLYILNYIDALILLFDFVVRFVRAPHKLRYLMPLGLLDLVGSLPGTPYLRLLRVPALVLDWRELRRGTARDLLTTARTRLAESTLLSGFIVVFLVMAVGGSAIVWVEAPVEGSNIKTGADALWYAIVTIATVGYGDRYPVTPAGRMIGTVMIVVGVGIFSVLTGYLSTLFLRARRPAHEHVDPLQQDVKTLVDEERADAATEVDALKAEIARLREQLTRQS